jgi:hypothetical protein
VNGLFEGGDVLIGQLAGDLSRDVALSALQQNSSFHR